MKLYSPRFSAVFAALALPLLSACAEGDGKAPKPDPKTAAAVEIPAAIFVSAAPSGSIGVREAVSSAKKGSEIVVRAVVGGRKKAFVDNRAILVAADAELKPCAAEEGCKTPWDYCCESKDTLLANTMTIQVVDAKGNPIETTLQGVHGLKELKTIVVAGSVRNADGSLVLDAKKIYVTEE